MSVGSDLAAEVSRLGTWWWICHPRARSVNACRLASSHFKTYLPSHRACSTRPERLQLLLFTRELLLDSNGVICKGHMRWCSSALADERFPGTVQAGGLVFQAEVPPTPLSPVVIGDTCRWFYHARSTTSLMPFLPQSHTRNASGSATAVL